MVTVSLEGDVFQPHSFNFALKYFHFVVERRRLTGAPAHVELTGNTNRTLGVVGVIPYYDHMTLN